MKAGEVVFQQLLDGKIQYRVPLFQRTYSWEEENWQRLWDDLLDIYDLTKPRSHFIGAVVTLPIPDSPEKCSKFMLIDGQQRLTTLFVLLAAIRDLAKSNGDQLADEIQEECLINRFAKGPEEFRKMKPTQADLAAFNAIVDGQSSAGTLIGKARAFFGKALDLGDLEGKPINLVKIKSCITDYLNLVSIRLDQDDSPHRIFESLNNTGQPLTASDLIRNYIFMSIPTEEEQAACYNKYWYPMQQRMEKELSPFVWRHLMKDGNLLRYDDVYEEMREYIDEGDETIVQQVLEDLDRYSQYYVKFWRPDPNEESLEVRAQFERLNAWEVDVAYPFLLTAMHKRATGVITDEDLLQLLRMIESYVVRRSICGIPTNRLRRIFALMSNQVSDDKFVETCRDYLIDNEWPTDDRFHEIFQTARIYVRSRLARARLILASLEKSFKHHEPIEMTDKITIEHLMPQTLNDEWRQELGPEFYRVHEELLHSIGNLTFSGYNQEMGNASFEYKKQILAESHFEMNRSIVQAEHWTEHEIRARAKELADRAVQIWRR